MKKISKYLSGLFAFLMLFTFTTKQVLADMLPPGNQFYKVPKDERAGILEIIEPQYIIIGITVIIGIIVSFALIAKLRDSEEESENE